MSRKENRKRNESYSLWNDIFSRDARLRSRRKYVLNGLNREEYLILCRKYDFSPDCSTTDDWIADLLLNLSKEQFKGLEEYIKDELRNEEEIPKENRSWHG